MTGWDPEFLSIEKILVAYLEQELGVTTAVELPHNVESDPDLDSLPIIVVDRISGADLSGSHALDRPVIDIDCYAQGPSRENAQDLAEQVRNRVMRLRGRRITIPDGAVVFGRVRTVVGPRNLPHNNPAVRRYNASYETLLHRQP